LFLIPNIIIVGYGRIQTMQYECLRCKTHYFPNTIAEPEVFCSNCLELSSGTLQKYISEDNLSEIQCVGNIVGWECKTDISLKRSKHNYKKTYIRDNYICQYCNYNPRVNAEFVALWIDHILPFSVGGGNTLNNLVVACQECNTIAYAKIFKTFEDKKKYILQRRIDKGLYVEEKFIKFYELNKK
jgi:hypothetical protein